MSNKDKLIHQLFIGLVSEALGFDKTNELLKEAYEAFKDYEVTKPIITDNNKEYFDLLAERDYLIDKHPDMFVKDFKQLPRVIEIYKRINEL